MHARAHTHTPRHYHMRTKRAHTYTLQVTDSLSTGQVLGLNLEHGSEKDVFYFNKIPQL